MNANDDEDRDDPVMDWALGERLGGERPRDLVAGVRARLAQGPAAPAWPRHGVRTQLLVAAFVLLGIGVVLGVALWPRGDGGDAPAQTPSQQEPKPAQVYSLADAAALPASARAVEVIDGDDAVIAALKRLRDLEVLIVREPFHENHGLGLKRMPPVEPKHVTPAAWPDLLSFTKLRTLELSGTLLLGRVRPEDIADGLERLPLLSTLALRCLDTDSQLLAVLPRIRGLQSLDLSYNHGFDDGWIEPVLRCRSLVSLSVDGCQQVHGAQLARLGELPLLEQIEAANIDGINWRNSGAFLDDTERDVIARAQRRGDRLGIGPSDEALEGFAKCKKLRVLDVASGHWSTAGLAHLGACTDLKVLNASGGHGHEDPFVASLPPGIERLEVCGDYTNAFCTAVAANLKSLRHLTIAACYQITDRGLAAVAAMPSLRVLDMRQMRGLTVATIDTLLAAQQLEDLDVRHCDFVTAEHVVQLRRSLPKLQHLEHSVDPAAVAAAEKLPEQLPRIGRGKEGIEGFLKTGLRSLDGVGFDDECLALLAESKVLENLVLRPHRDKTVPFQGPVAPVTDAGMRELAKIATLRGLHLDRCRKVTSDGLAVIAQLPVLEELRFSVMSVPDEFFVRLKGTPLKRLTIDGCRGFGRAGVEAIAGLRDLRELSLRGCVHLDEDWIAGLASLPRLERLDLSFIGSRTYFSGLSEFGAHVEPGSGVSGRAIAALAKLATLRELSLAHGAVDAAALRSLHAVPTLESLDLTGTEVTSADLEALPRTLTRLVLGNCQRIGQDFGVALAKATPNLHTLVLANSDALRDECLASLRGVRSLRELELSWCGKFTSAAADGLAALTQVEQLTLKGWEAFGSEQWARIRAMPNLKVIETDDMSETLRK